MLSTRTTNIFNKSDRFVEGWYWAIRSDRLRRGEVKAVTLLGRYLVLYRGTDGKVVAMDAYCPHMGAHLAEGRVEGCAIRCFFHNWKFNSEGDCVESPALDEPASVKVKTWHVAERYGMVWVWAGAKPTESLPFVAELGDEDCDYQMGRHFIRNCHPHVVLINAIDAHHFNTVHNLPLQIVFEKQDLNEKAIAFSNMTRGGEESRLIRLIRPLYRKEVTYRLCYWYGSAGIVTVGPDFLHFYILFALRSLAGGKTEGQTILLTPRRSGLSGWVLNRVLLWLTELVGNYFGKGDTQIFQTIKFDLKTPTKADRAIVQFIQHVEQQVSLQWETWEKI
jgi:phenylpropionate dioxygenase-like ring-hydroxylating dioxygenase large terminal subunit